jgi:hypothetical protein
MASSGHVTVTSGEKGPTRADIVQLPVAHAQNILPNMTSSDHVTAGHVTDVTSGQACAIVRSSSILRKCDFVRTHILLIYQRQ